MLTGDFRYPYFLGIGGIGMSALAWYYLQNGAKPSGYDRVPSSLTRQLERAGIGIHYDEAPEKIPVETDAVIYTPAIPGDHAEWAEIRHRGLPVFKRAEVLGWICRRYRTLAVAGTHGKTTTSSMLAYLLRQSIGCNAILGGISLDLGGNYHYDASSPFMVTEADEYDRSFWQLHPWFSVVTAWDADHLDIYGTLENMRDAYRQFMRQSEHFIAYEGLRGELDAPEADGFYGIAESAGKRVPAVDAGAGTGCCPFSAQALHLEVGNGAYRFDYAGPRATIQGLELHCPGRHNVLNAVAAITLALEAGVAPESIKRLLPAFKGVARRLELKAEAGNVRYYDDYAHHPAEIEASIVALREFYPKARLCVVFQPHLYTRTRDLAPGFARSLSMADEVFLADIYPAREMPLPGVDTRLIGREMLDKDVYYGSREEALEWLSRKIAQAKEEGTRPVAEKEGLLLVTMGAGDIDRIVDKVVDSMREGGAL
ncbi:MAG: UDP-N-acetylmuramate--L-alanine ligase [Bacteroidetes bacterium]|uniref:UDP-N-acetylmuramate--L-alanine ligase n=1 Tax=Candidatus Pullibacteroides excrementavium TaxID=2840905 RepID=A0A9D9H0Y4_9BACT|nr:UDP-N-acetylmuramate--L-alanine ligase [Candidatus Pullibacteroides excrementavium]